jgi:hypothetical protein
MGKEQFPKIKEDIVDKTPKIYKEIDSLCRGANAIIQSRPFAAFIWYLVKRGVL